LNPEDFGTTGRNNVGGCVLDGKFNETRISLDGSGSTPDGCLKRYFQQNSNTMQGTSSMVVYSEDLMLSLIALNPETRQPWTDYDSFRFALENMPHNSIHVAVGSFSDGTWYGEPGTMSVVSQSSMDPIFFLHHNNIERYFKYWQKQNKNLASTYNGARNYPPASTNNIGAQLTNVLPSFNLRVGEGLKFEVGDFCYTFQPYSKSLLASPNVWSKNGHLLKKREDGNETTTAETAAPVPVKEAPKDVQQILEILSAATNSVNTTEILNAVSNSTTLSITTTTTATTTTGSESGSGSTGSGGNADANANTAATKVIEELVEKPPAPRYQPAPIDERFLRLMGMSNQQIEKVRAHEENIKVQQEKLNELTDKVLKEYFEVDNYEDSGFLVTSAAKKLALGMMVTEAVQG
jgi:hypothetical protein